MLDLFEKLPARDVVAREIRQREVRPIVLLADGHSFHDFGQRYSAFSSGYETLRRGWLLVRFSLGWAGRLVLRARDEPMYRRHGEPVGADDFFKMVRNLA